MAYTTDDSRGKGVPPENFLEPKTQTNEVKVKTAPEQNRRIPALLGFLVLVISVLALYFLVLMPWFDKVDHLADQLAGMENRMALLEADLHELVDRIPTPMPTPVPTPLPPSWLFSGQIGKINSQEPFPDLTVRLVIWADREGASRETIAPEPLSPDGRFNIVRNLPVESGWVVQATIEGLPQPWQLQLPPDESVWQVGQLPNSFEATFERTEDIRPLLLTAVVRRTFSGEAGVWTNPDTFTNLGNIPITLSVSPDNVQWRPVTMPESYTTDEDGNFEIVFDSEVELAWYRIEANLPDYYQIGAITQSLQEWVVGPEMVARTNQEISAGDFRDIRIQQQLFAIEMLPDEVIAMPSLDRWQFMETEYPFYKIEVTNTETISAVWEVLLPAGRYQFEVWTPANVANATVRYTVEPEQGFSTGHSNCDAYQSVQGERDGNWWDFLSSVRQAPLLIDIPRDSKGAIPVTVTARVDDVTSVNLSKTMAISPVRFVVTNEYPEFEFPDCAKVALPGS